MSYPCKMWSNLGAAALAAAPHVAWLSVLFLYLGTAVWSAPPDDDGVPSSAATRLVFMLAVAVLVARHMAELFHGVRGFLFEVLMTILICNLALSLVWDLLERAVYALVVPLHSLISRTVGVELGEVNLQLAATSVLAATLLIWVTLSVTSTSRIIKKVRRIFCLDPFSVRILKLVEVRRIIPRSHATQTEPPELIHAPGSWGRNPLIDPPPRRLALCD